MNFKKLVLCLAALPMAVAVSAATVGESKATETGWLINKTDYTGTLNYDEMDYNHGFYSVCNNTQGDNNWFSVYGDAMGSYKKMTAINGETNHFKGANTWNCIDWKENFGPDGGDAAIALWRAPWNGSVRFSGRIYKTDFNEGSDGVEISVANKKSTGVASTTVVSQIYTANFETVMDQTVTVVSGEMYMFSVGQYINSRYDTTHLQLKAEFTKDEQNPGTQTTGTDVEPTHLKTEGFLIDKQDYAGSLNTGEMDYNHGYVSAPNADQGDNNWFVAKGKSMGSYSKMTDTSGDHSGNAWKGNDYNCGLWWKENLGADAGDDAIVIWRAPFNGTVKFAGRIFRKTDSAGTSAIVSVVNKKATDIVATEVVTKTCSGLNTLVIDKEVTVVSGEMYMFSVGQPTLDACSGATGNIKATFTKDEQNPGTQTTGTAIEPTGYAEAKIFADGYMHMTDYTEELGYCKDSEHAYYAKAKTAYTAMSQSGKQSFNSHADYAAAKARLAAWAKANGDQIDATSLEIVAGAPVFELNRTTTDSTALIIVACVIAVASLSVLVVLKSVKRRKHN